MANDSIELGRIRAKVLRLEDKTDNISYSETTSSISGSVNISGNLSFAPAAETKILLNSKVNAGSDKAFILYKEESSYHVAGSSQENSRLSIGVYNDNESNYGEGLDLQGGASLIFNVGSWDNELTAAIGTQYAPVGSPPGYPIKFRINNSDVAAISSSGNFIFSNSVGIGTNTPLSPLHLKSTGPIQFIIEADSDNISESDNANILLSQDGGLVQTQIGMFDSENNFRLSNSGSGNNVDIWFGAGNGTEKLRIKSSGEIGIGTSIPTKPLHLSASTSDPVMIENSSDGNFNRILYKKPSRMWSIGQTAGNDLGIADETANVGHYRFLIDSSGRFAINGSSTTTLTVNCTRSVSDGIIINNTNADYQSYLLLNATGSSVWQLGKQGAASSHQFFLWDQIGGRNVLIANRGTDGALSLQPANGNVGIGTTSPSDKLQVSGPNDRIGLNTAGTTSTLNFGSTVSGEGTRAINFDRATGLLKIQGGNVGSLADYVTINTAGNVGIGTANPAAASKLHVNGGLAIIGTSTGYGFTQFGSSSTATNNWHIGSDSDNKFRIYNGNWGSGAEKVAIDTNGNVGIGTTSPSYKLHVLGAAAEIARFENAGTNDAFIRVRESSTEDVVLGSTSGTGFVGSSTNTNFAIRTNNSDKVTITTAGNVGVGVSPTYKLDVNGSIRATADSVINNNQIFSDDITINGLGSGNRYAYVDMVGDDTYTDYGLRLIRQNGGPNTTSELKHRGTGNLYIYCVESSNIVTLTNNTNRNVTDAAGPFRPYYDNNTSLGNSSFRWTAVYAANGTIQTSDEREKTNISSSILGLKFIKDLNPVSYKWKIGQVYASSSIDGYNDEINDNIVTQTTSSRPGIRTHYGLIAQEVKSVLEKNNIDSKDFAGYVYDEESDTYALRYDEFISPMIKSIQELSEENDYLKNKLEEKDKQIEDILLRLAALEGK